MNINKSIPDMKYEIENHPYFAEFINDRPTIIIDPIMVNSKTLEKDNDDINNDLLVFWVEVLIPVKINENDRYHYSYRKDVTLSHDTDLDCSGSSYEESIKTVWTKFCDIYGYTSFDECHDSAIASILNHKVQYRSGVEILINDLMCDYRCIRKDMEYMNIDNLKKTILKFNGSSRDEPYMYIKFENNKIITSYTSENVVSIDGFTRRIDQVYELRKNNEESEFMNIMIFRMFNVKYLEILLHNKTFIIDQIKFNEDIL